MLLIKKNLLFTIFEYNKNNLKMRAAESQLKYILNAKEFSFDKFMEKYFPDFWKSMLDYLVSMNSKNNNAKPGKFVAVDFQRIIQALNIILPKLKQGSYNSDILADADNFFGMVFHPQSSDELREMFSPIYFNFLESCNESEISRLKYSFKYYIPLPFIAADDADRIQLKNFADKEIDPVIFDQTKEKNGQCEASTYIQNILNWIVNHWESKSSSMIKPLIQNIMTAIYFNEAKSLNMDIPPYHLKNTVPPVIHEQFCQFFTNLFDDTRNFNTLFETTTLNFVTLVFKASLLSVSQDAFRFTLQALIEIITNQNLYKAFATTGLIPQICEIATDLFITFPSPAFGAQLSEFAYFLHLDRRSLSTEIRIQNLTTLLNFAKKDNSAKLTVFGAILACSLTNGEEDPAMWDALVSFIYESDTYAAIASKYMQLFATLQFPKIFSIDMETIIDECELAYDRNQRNKNTTDHDFVSSHIKQILNDPQSFIHDEIYVSWPEYEKYRKILKKVPFCPAANLKKLSDLVSTAAEEFMTALDKYITRSDDESKCNAFSVINSYYDIFVMLKNLPPDVSYTKLSPFQIASHRLFEALTTQTNTDILLQGFKTLSALFCTADIKNHIPHEMLSMWYTIVIYCILSKSSELSELAYKAAVSTVMIGFQGSTLLIPTLMKYCLNKIVECPETTSLFSSSALFRVKHKVEHGFYDSMVSQLEKRKETLCDNWKDIFARFCLDQLNTAARIIERITNPELMLSISIPFIVDEINQYDPNVDIVVSLFNKVVDLAVKHDIGALQMIKVVCNYSLLTNIANSEFEKGIQRIVSMSESMNVETDPEYLFIYLQLMSSILISSDNVGRNLAPQFSAFITRVLDFKTPEEYPQQIKKFAAAIKELMSIFLGAYPFNTCPELPSARNVKNPDSLSILFPNDTYVNIDKLPHEGTSFTTNGRCGQFIFDFYPYTQSIDMPAPEFDLFKDNHINTPINDVSGQEEFSSTFDNVSRRFFDVDSLSLDAIDEKAENVAAVDDEVEKYYAEHMQYQKPDEAKHMRAPLTTEFPAAAALTAVGLIDSEQPRKIKRTAIRANRTTSVVMKSENVDVLLMNSLRTDHRTPEKAALCYVGEGSMVQSRVLRTDLPSVSPRFKEFFSMLGWNVTLKNWPLYSAGLDTYKDANGVSSLYTSGVDFELMYHVAPLMPTNPKDEQCIDKKKHIGNDHVQVIYVESDNQYDPLTITSQFNFVTIVVYPLQTGLYRLDVHHRDGMKWFGPLNGPVICTKNCLYTLITSTITSVMMSIRFAQLPYNHPILELERKMMQVITEYTKDNETPYAALMDLQIT